MLSTPSRSVFSAFAAALVLTVAGPARSAAVYDPRDVRAAQLAAYRALAESVLDLKTGYGSSVQAWVGGSNHRAAGLNHFIKQADLSAPRPHGKLLAVEATLSRDALIQTLTDLDAADLEPGTRLLVEAGPAQIVAVGVAKPHYPAEQPDEPDAAQSAQSAPADSDDPAPGVLAASPAADPSPAPRPVPGAFRRYADDPARPVITPDPGAAVERRRQARGGMQPPAPLSPKSPNEQRLDGRFEGTSLPGVGTPGQDPAPYPAADPVAETASEPGAALDRESPPVGDPEPAATENQP